MKPMRHILAILLVIIYIPQVGPEKEMKTKYVDMEFENFMKAYSHVRKWEGNYSHLVHDSGGETYAGITRKFNPDWEGWNELDEFKKSNEVKWNTHIPEMEVFVKRYYYRKWKEGHYDKIKNFVVAAYLFDYSNTGIIAIKHTKEILIENGYDVKANHKLDLKTVEAINKMNPIEFLAQLMTIRKEFYYNVTLKKPEMEIYLKGWMNRAESIVS